MKKYILLLLTIPLIASAQFNNGYTTELVKKKFFFDAVRSTKDFEDKALLAIEYSVSCENSKKFGFVNLPEQYYLDHARDNKLIQGVLELDLEAELSKGMKRKEHRGLAMALRGHFYHLNPCGLSVETKKKAKKLLLKAEKSGALTYYSANSLAEIYWKEGKIKKAESYLLKSLELYSKYVRATMNLAGLRFVQKKWMSSSVMAKRAVDMALESQIKSNAAVIVASSAHHFKNKKEALEYIAIAEKYRYKNFYNLYLTTHRIAVGLGEKALARRLAKTVMDAFPKEKIVRQKIHDNCMTGGMPEEAIFYK